MFEITFPIPPSVNGLYPGKSRRYMSTAYKNWILECWEILRGIEIPTYEKHVHINYRFYPKNKTFGDTQNYVKAATDMLVKAKVIKDDKHTVLVSEHIQFAGYDKDRPRVEITVEGI